MMRLTGHKTLNYLLTDSDDEEDCPLVKGSLFFPREDGTLSHQFGVPVLLTSMASSMHPPLPTPHLLNLHLLSQKRTCRTASLLVKHCCHPCQPFQLVGKDVFVDIDSQLLWPAGECDERQEVWKPTDSKPFSCPDRQLWDTSALGQHHCRPQQLDRSHSKCLEKGSFCFKVFFQSKVLGFDYLDCTKQIL